MIALGAYPDLDIPTWTARLDALADEARAAGGDLPALLRVLFEAHELRGNSDDYDDPRNSYLNDVLERGLGLPITLSVVLIEVGRRLGLPLAGVGFPAHFLVRHDPPEGEPVFIDAFHRGRTMTRDDCAELLRTITHGAVRFHDRLLDPIGSRSILARMLRNLKRVHLQRRDLPQALLDVERLLALEPGIPTEVRDRGLLRLELQRYALAASDLEAYVTGTPEAPDVKAIVDKLNEARRGLWSLN